MRRECRERFPRHRGLAIPICITTRAWRTCHDACRDLLTGGFLWSRWRGKGSRHSRRMRSPQFYVSGKQVLVRGPCRIPLRERESANLKRGKFQRYWEAILGYGLLIAPIHRSHQFTKSNAINHSTTNLCTHLTNYAFCFSVRGPWLRRAGGI